MNKFLSFSVLFGLTILPAPLFSFNIIKDGKPAAVIVTPDNPDAIVLDAAQCLNTYLEKIANVQLNVIPESEAEKVSGNMIVLGATQLAQQEKIDISVIEYDGYIHKVSKNKFFIVGPDEPFPIKKSILEKKREEAEKYQNKRGTLNGVIQFLYEYCGVRWFIPTPMGEKIPKNRNVSVPDNLYRKENPAFPSAFAWNWAYYPGFYWAAANSFRTPVRIFWMGGHSWDTQITVFGGTPEKLYSSHPEYFALIKGKRIFKEKSCMLCTSNPEVVDMLTKVFQQFFDEGWDWIQYNQSDSYRRCECPKCEAMDNYRGYERGRFTEPCERLLLCAKEIADRCYKTHPDKKILMLSYGPTKLPSIKFDRFPPNVVLQMCNSKPQNFELWNNRADNYAVWLYWFGMYQPPGIAVKFTPQASASIFLQAKKGKTVPNFKYLSHGILMTLNRCFAK